MKDFFRCWNMAPRYTLHLLSVIPPWDRLHVKQEKSHGRNSTPPPLAISAKLCLIDHRNLDTSRSYGTQDRSISTVYSCPFNQLSLIVIERHTRFLQSKQGTEVDEPTRRRSRRGQTRFQFCIARIVNKTIINYIIYIVNCAYLSV